jgi:hypothetical protein
LRLQVQEPAEAVAVVPLMQSWSHSDEVEGVVEAVVVLWMLLHLSSYDAFVVHYENLGPWVSMVQVDADHLLVASEAKEQRNKYHHLPPFLFLPSIPVRHRHRP